MRKAILYGAIAILGSIVVTAVLHYTGASQWLYSHSVWGINQRLNDLESLN